MLRGRTEEPWPGWHVWKGLVSSPCSGRRRVVTVLTCLVPRGALSPCLWPPGAPRVDTIGTLDPVCTSGALTPRLSFFCFVYVPFSAHGLSSTGDCWVGLVGLDASPFWGRAKVHPRLRAPGSWPSSRGPSQGVLPAPEPGARWASGLSGSWAAPSKVPQWKQRRDFIMMKTAPTDSWCFTKLYALLYFPETKFIFADLVTLAFLRLFSQEII